MKSIPSPEPLIDPVHRFVMFTNAKCGGTTLKRWFFTNLDLARLERAPITFLRTFGSGYSLRHLRSGRRLLPRGDHFRDGAALQSMAHFYRLSYCVPALRSGATDGFFRFAVVREPASRLLSAYLDKFCGEGRGKPWARAVADRFGDDGELSFDQFLDYLATADEAKMNPHWRRQTYVLEGQKIDAFVRLERISEDFAAIANRVGAGHVGILGEDRLNAAPSAKGNGDAPAPLTAIRSNEIAQAIARGEVPPKAAFLTDATRARIREIYAADYAALPY